MCLPLARFFWGHSEICFTYNLKKHCEAKILLAIWDTFIYIKKLQSYKFNYKVAFTFILSLRRNQTQESNFTSWLTGNKKHFVYSESPSISKGCEFNRLSERNFATCNSCSYYNSLVISTRTIYFCWNHSNSKLHSLAKHVQVVLYNEMSSFYLCLPSRQ